MSAYLTVDTSQIDELARRLRGIPRGVTKVAVTAMNRTATSTRAEMVRLVRGDYNLKAKAVRDNIRISKASWGNPEATVSSKDGPGIPLKEFSPQPRSAPSTRRLKSGAYRPAGGISAIVTKSKGRQMVKGAFLARMSSGHVGVFIRGAQARGARRLSALGARFIKEVYGPSATYILRSGKYDEELGRFVDRTFERNFIHNARRAVDRELKR
jgi:hypothetical protein